MNLRILFSALDNSSYVSDIFHEHLRYANSTYLLILLSEAFIEINYEQFLLKSIFFELNY